MALNFSTQNTDFVQRTAEPRKITKTFVGDFTFDIFSNKYRNKVFLPRNMTKVLAFHDRNLFQGIESGVLRSSSLRSRGPYLCDGSAKTNGDHSGETVNGNATQVDLPSSTSHILNNQDSSRAKPDIESMSQQCLKVKSQNGSTEDQAREKRRSVRHQLARQHEDKNANLYFNIVNIRKKLNFKETASDAEQRPRKRMRRESITCHCHITIWDNRKGLDQKEPIIRKSEICEVSTTDLGVAGFSAEIKLRNPFVFKSSELFVSLPTPQGTVLGIGDQYFLEVKIIPTKDDVDWPPIPVLGRSEGDQSQGLGRMAAEKLQGSLVARYLHLPQAPASDVPLSVFFLHDGTTYRSKYGLEVSSIWSKGEIPEVMMKREEEEIQVDLWKLDQAGQGSGPKSSPRVKDTEKVRSTLDSKSAMKQTRKQSPPVRVLFNLDGSIAKGAKEFRKSTLMGLRCPACSSLTFDNLEELQFHFLTYHPKYKFIVEKQDLNSTTNELISVTFKITATTSTRPRNQDREPRKSDKDIKWQAPAEPLNIPAFVNGDHSWVEGNWVDGQPKKPEPSAAMVTVVPDAFATMRSRQRREYEPAQKGGFLPAEHVADFRKSDRKRYPNIRLKAMTSDKQTMYTSISHRQVRVGEEARSESDDEMDDSWFVKKSLEALDIAAEKQEWSEEQRLLRRKWTQARLNEKLSHPRYLSDGLIRFVRAEKLWINSGSLDRQAAFAEFIGELLQRRVINQEVVRDIWVILHSSENTQVSLNNVASGRKEIVSPVYQRIPNWREEQRPATRQERAENMLRLPPYSCGICTKPVEDLRRYGLHCSEHECEAPGAWYHNKCVRCKRKDKLNWKCELCLERIEESKKLKGKDVATN